MQILDVTLWWDMHSTAHLSQEQHHLKCPFLSEITVHNWSQIVMTKFKHPLYRFLVMFPLFFKGWRNVLKRLDPHMIPGRATQDRTTSLSCNPGECGTNENPIQWGAHYINKTWSTATQDVTTASPETNEREKFSLTKFNCANLWRTGMWSGSRVGSDGSMSASGSAGPGFDPRRGSKFSYENFQPWG